MLSQAVTELENKLLKLSNISYGSIDSLMRKIMKSYDITAKKLHNAFKSKNKKTPDNWVKEKMKKLQEDHKEIASGKKQDDEGYAARNELDTIEKAIKNLRKSIKSGDQQLPAWVQSKITKAADYIDTASEYLESDERVDEARQISFPVKKSSGAGALTPQSAKQLGDKAVKLQKQKSASVSLPIIRKEEISLVEKILGEEKCGKGMYWCNTDEVCKSLRGLKVSGQKVEPTEVGIGKPVAEGSCNHTEKGKSCSVHGTDQCPMSEERDPKGPVKSYKSPEELAKKHGVSVEQIKKQLEIGTKVEFEHTTSKSSARITALQHLDEKPDYYTKLKKMETQKENNTVRDANGNVYAEFVDIIKSGSIEEENPCWKGYKQVGTKKKGRKEVPNCVPVKEESIDEAVRLQAQTGNNIFVTLSWRGKYYTMQLFFPQAKIPSRIEISDEMQKIYPGSRVVTYRVADFKPGEPILYAYRGGDAGKLGPNKNYVKPMGEEVELDEGIIGDLVDKIKGRKKVGTTGSGGAIYAPIKPKPSKVVYGSGSQEPKDTKLVVTNADKKANTPAWQNYTKGDPRYKAKNITKEEVEIKSEMPPTSQSDLVNKAKKATKRSDTNIDGFVDDKDGKTGPYGAFIPSVDGKGKLYTDLNVKNESVDKSKMPCNKPKAQAVGDSQTGKSHVVKACSDGREKLIRFGQRGVKGSPKKKGESEAYASRRNRFKTRHAKNISKGKMSAAYWANKVKW